MAATKPVSFRTKLTLGISVLVLLTGAALTGFAFVRSSANTAVLADALFGEVTAHAVTQARDHGCASCRWCARWRRSASAGWRWTTPTGSPSNSSAS